MTHQGSNSSSFSSLEGELFPGMKYIKDYRKNRENSSSMETEKKSESKRRFALHRGHKPSEYNTAQSSEHTAKEDQASNHKSELSDSSSTHEFRKIFGGARNIPEADLSSDNVHNKDETYTISRASLYAESSAESFDKSIIDYMVRRPQQAKRRNYLEEYEDLFRNEHDVDSVFGLSGLNDYERFVKSSYISGAIRNRIDCRRDNDSNNLSVISTSELKEKYFQGDCLESLNYEKKSPAKPLPWFNKKLKVNCTEYIEQRSSLFSQESTDFLQRKLKVRHLQMISLGATIGVGLVLNSGKCFTIAGPFGTVLAFMTCGIIVLATVMSFCEMVSFVSIIDGVSGLSSRFVNDSFGFAVGWLYFASFAFGLAGEIVASVIMLSYYPYLHVTSQAGVLVGFVTLFLSIILLSNLIDVRVFGEIEYFTSLIKLICALGMLVVMVYLNRGGFNGDVLGFRYWTYSKSDFEDNIIFGLFRPSFNLHDTGTSSPMEGIRGAGGRFLSFLCALSIASYAYSGSEIVCIAACESKNPRKALPSATKRVFFRILLFYFLSAFCVSINIYSGDPRLLRYLSGSTGVSSSSFSNNIAIQYVGGAHCNMKSDIYGGYASGSQSPWIVALSTAGLCKFSSIVNGFIVFFAISCGNAQLYVSSRTLYSLALQGKAPKIFVKCNRFGIPYNSVLAAASFGIISYICVSEKATVVFQYLTSVISSSGIIVWFAMCLSYLRFFYGLKMRPDIISRADKSYPYRSPFQPYSAYLGLIGSGFIVITMGFIVVLHGEWDTLFFFSNYGSLVLFVVLYVAHKVVKGSFTPSLEALDFDSGRREMDQYIWDGERERIGSVKGFFYRVLYFFA